MSGVQSIKEERGAGAEMAGGGHGAGTRVCCLVPRLEFDLCDELHEHWRDDPAITVVVDHRGCERRRATRRADGHTQAQAAAERRHVRSGNGRRIAERRALTFAVAPLPLPRVARRRAEQLTFVERIEPRERASEDIETDRLVVRAQSGDRRALEQIYLGYFDRVFSYAHLLVRNFHEAEDVTQQVFIKVMGAIPRYEIDSGKPFRHWLFCITRNTALRSLERSGRVQLEDSPELNRRLQHPAEEAYGGLGTFPDSDLTMLVDRLPLAQRQALILRFGLDLSTSEIATLMERTPRAVRLLQHRALRTLERRLTALRQPRSLPLLMRTPMRVRVKPLPVLSSRRFVLSAPPHALVRGRLVA